MDNYSRQCLAIHVGQSLKGEDVAAVVERLKINHNVVSGPHRRDSQPPLDCLPRLVGGIAPRRQQVKGDSPDIARINDRLKEIREIVRGIQVEYAANQVDYTPDDVRRALLSKMSLAA